MLVCWRSIPLLSDSWVKVKLIAFQFTTYRFYQTVEPGKEVTFEYRFVPSEALSSRPFGLVINVNYKDSELSYLDAVFNTTINVVEPDEGFDGETWVVSFSLESEAFEKMFLMRALLDGEELRVIIFTVLKGLILLSRFFMYAFLLAVVVLIIFGAYHLFGSIRVSCLVDHVIPWMIYSLASCVN